MAGKQACCAPAKLCTGCCRNFAAGSVHAPPVLTGPERGGVCVFERAGAQLSFLGAMLARRGL